MTSVKAFAGALQPKKKSELQEIAAALRISDQGTKDEIQTRIRNYLDKHQTTLEDDPAFAGLFGRRKRSAQPQPPPSRGGDSSDELSTTIRAAVSRRAATLESIRESTPINDPGEVSLLLKSDIPSPGQESIRSGGTRYLPQPGSPTRFPPPQSPDRNLLNTVSRSRVNEIVGAVKQQEENVLQNTTEMVLSLRSFLSNSRNIWSLTAALELIYILYAIVPWQAVELPLSHDAKSSLPAISLSLPTWVVFRTSVFWSIIGHWAISSLIIPALFGALISFHPATSARSQANADRSPKPALIPFDPLTASIIRLAAQIAYPVGTMDSKAHVMDVIGFRWRVLSAAVSVAFAFAEAISATSTQFNQRLASAQQKTRRKSTTDNPLGVGDG